ncbi:MAG: hypothetical protein OEQ29_14740 [Alphaproteobacteria bacterium]|nr:hypothetical protein [Alphaproteobacteria bacterium]
MENLELPDGYSKRYIAFLDILGFSDAIAKSQRNPEVFKKIYNALDIAQTLSNPGTYGQGDVRANAFSDSIIISAEDSLFGIKELVDACEQVSVGILAAGLLCRGAIHWGDLCHDESYVFGPGLVKAYRMESTQAVYPRIIVTRELLEKMAELAAQHEPSDWLGDMFRRDGDGCVYLDTLGWFEELLNNEDKNENGKGLKILGLIRDFLEFSANNFVDNPNLFSKYEWMINEYNDLVSKNKIVANSLEHISQYHLPAELASISGPDKLPSRRKGQK